MKFFTRWRQGCGSVRVKVSYRESHSTKTFTVYRRTIEIPQRARILKVNFCLKVHNAHFVARRGKVLYSNTHGLYHFKFPIEVNVIFAGWVSQPKTERAGLELTQPIAKEKMAT